MLVNLAVRALPEKLADGFEGTTTGIGCVECPGVLRVYREGAGAPKLKFVCRVGHVFSVDELIAGKERLNEERLWAALLAAEELAAVLDELDRAGSAGASARREAYAERCARLRAQGRTLRELIERNEPVNLTGSEEREPSDRSRGERR